MHLEELAHRHLVCGGWAWVVSSEGHKLPPLPSLSRQNKGKYEVMVGSYKSAAELLDLYVDLLNKYPYIVALIDPFRKEVSAQHVSHVVKRSHLSHFITKQNKDPIRRACHWVHAVIWAGLGYFVLAFIKRRLLSK